MRTLFEMYLDYNTVYEHDFTAQNGSKGVICQGSAPPNGRDVADEGFDVLVLAANENQNADDYEGVEVICAPGEDGPNPLPEELELWKNAAIQVAERVRAGARVLVTCIAGRNRSGMVSAMAIHELTNWDPQKIIWWISRRRPHALSNPDFVEFLVNNLEGKSND